MKSLLIALIVAVAIPAMASKEIKDIKPGDFTYYFGGKLVDVGPFIAWKKGKTFMGKKFKNNPMPAFTTYRPNFSNSKIVGGALVMSQKVKRTGQVITVRVYDYEMAVKTRDPKLGILIYKKLTKYVYQAGVSSKPVKKEKTW